jgi:hypothetical protein
MLHHDTTNVLATLKSLAIRLGFPNPGAQISSSIGKGQWEMIDSEMGG